jgi:hypothetical protein
MSAKKRFLAGAAAVVAFAAAGQALALGWAPGPSIVPDGVSPGPGLAPPGSNIQVDFGLTTGGSTRAGYPFAAELAFPTGGLSGIAEVVLFPTTGRFAAGNSTITIELSPNAQWTTGLTGTNTFVNGGVGDTCFSALNPSLSTGGASGTSSVVFVVTNLNACGTDGSVHGGAADLFPANTLAAGQDSVGLKLPIKVLNNQDVTMTITVRTDTGQIVDGGPYAATLIDSRNAYFATINGIIGQGAQGDTRAVLTTTPQPFLALNDNGVIGTVNVGQTPGTTYIKYDSFTTASLTGVTFSTTVGGDFTGYSSFTVGPLTSTITGNSATVTAAPPGFWNYDLNAGGTVPLIMRRSWSTSRRALWTSRLLARWNLLSVTAPPSSFRGSARLLSPRPPRRSTSCASRTWGSTRPACSSASATRPTLLASCRRLARSCRSARTAV